MGQYFLVVNLDKKQFIHPHRFGDGLKLLEFGCSQGGTLTGLTLLLRKSDGGGGGDFHDSDKFPIVGSWAGDRISIVGDYDESGLYDEAEETYEDVSPKVIEAMLLGDAYVAVDLYKVLVKRTYDEETQAILKKIKVPAAVVKAAKEAEKREEKSLRPDMVIGPGGVKTGVRL